MPPKEQQQNTATSMMNLGGHGPKIAVGGLSLLAFLIAFGGGAWTASRLYSGFEQTLKDVAKENIAMAERQTSIESYISEYGEAIIEARNSAKEIERSIRALQDNQYSANRAVELWLSFMAMNTGLKFPDVVGIIRGRQVSSMNIYPLGVSAD